MAGLSAAQRKSIPTSKFGVPSKAKTPAGKAKSGSFPMNDLKHARLAVQMSGHASPEDRARIKAKARSMGVTVGGAKSKGSANGKR